MKKLHLGCGKRNFGSSWIHIDGGDHQHLYSKDITKLPFDDNSIDLIYASHVIAYFDREEIISLLNEWKRVLKNDGILRLATPDFSEMIRLYHNKVITLKDIIGPLYGKMKMGNSIIYHKTTYDFESLKEILKELGFKNINRYNWKQTEHSEFDDHSQAYLPKMDKDNGTLISLNIECIK